MSSTGRATASGSGHRRRLDDAYETESRVVRALTEKLLPIEPAFVSYTVCDAGSGSGAIGAALMQQGFSDVYGVEQRPDLASRCLEHYPTYLSNYLDVGAKFRPCSMVVMNPPFLQAQEFVERALEQVHYEQEPISAPYPTVIALLRLNWLGSKMRAPFHRKMRPLVWVLPGRPSFTGDGKTDSTEYAWFVWTKNPKFEQKTWDILHLGPREKRVPYVRPQLPVFEEENL